MKKERGRPLKDNALTFDLWLYVEKHYGQTFDAAKMIYNQLSEGEKEALKEEYDKYVIKAAGD